MARKIAILICLIVGAIGAAGQAIILRHDLVDCYPYKMLVRFSDLYGQIGNSGAIVGPIVAVGAMIGFVVFKKDWLLFGPAIATVICPLVFLLVFYFFFWKSPFTAADLARREVEFGSADSLRALFTHTALGLTIEGMLEGLFAGALITLGQHFIPKLVTYKFR